MAECWLLEIGLTGEVENIKEFKIEDTSVYGENELVSIKVLQNESSIER